MLQYKIDNNDRNVYPMGLTSIEGGIHISAAAAAEECSLLLFLPEHERTGEGTGKEAEGASEEAMIRIPFPKEGRMGNVWEMTVLAEGLDRYEYALEIDHEIVPDPCGRRFLGREEWGNAGQVYTVPKTPIRQEPFDWEGDQPLRIPYEECIIYRSHVRGLTMHASSKGKEKGTFRGVAAKIPYLKELGITTLELMPTAEFQEVMMQKTADGGPKRRPEPTGRINYWGYTAALNYAPKAAYAGMGRNPVTELKQLVKTLHKAGIELVMELYFTGQEPAAAVLDTVRFWVREYHLDGVHLTGQVPAELLAQDPYLSDTKLWAVSWPETKTEKGCRKHLGEYNEGFLIDMRRVLKGDEGQMNQLAFRTRRNPADFGVINFIAGTNGFTMMDMVCYEKKHNEDNGEKNQDGSDYNYTWNCGVEGPARRKKVAALRRKQLRNAMLLVFLSQGTPLLLAGDEFGNTQNGNNNAYCQDNEISWLNWNQKRTNHDLFEFAKHVIEFRKAHPVFHMEKEPRVMDYLACGHPDMSFHGEKAWCPEFDSSKRQLGVMYCGKYASPSDKTEDDYFFAAYNMHWEPLEFALPNLPKPMRWHISMNTDDGDRNGYYTEGEEPEIEDQKQYMVPARTIMVFVGKTPKILDKE